MTAGFVATDHFIGSIPDHYTSSPSINGNASIDMYLAAQPFTIGSSILDIGSRKGQRHRQRSAMEPSSMMLGVPGQFDLPAVNNVSVVLGHAWLCSVVICFTYLISCSPANQYHAMQWNAICYHIDGPLLPR